MWEAIDLTAAAFWALSSTVLLAVLYAFIKANATTSWAQREIFGAQTKIIPNVGMAIFALGMGLSAFLWKGMFLGIVTSTVSFLFMHSAITDWRSSKAPRELSTFSWSLILTAIASDYFINYSNVSEQGLFFALTGIITWILLWVVLKIVSPGGIGMADIRILGVVALMSFWLSPIYLLLTVLIASPIQVVLRRLYWKKSSAPLNPKVAPFIPALVFSSFVSAPLAVIIGV